MLISRRQFYRVPIFALVKYKAGNRDGYGSVTDVSPSGWRIFGTMPVEAGDVCALKVKLPTKEWVSVAAGRVQWTCGEACGIQTLMINTHARERIIQYIFQRIRAL